MKFKFPYKFKGFISRDKLNEYIMTRKVKFIPLRRVNMYLGKGALQSFGGIYTDVLQAMTDFDYDYLSSIMEPKLYNAVKESLENLQDKNYALEYIEQNIHESEAQEAEEAEEEEEVKEGKEGEDDKKVSKDKNKFMGMDVNEGAIGEILNGPLGFVYGEKDLQIYMEARGAFGVNINRSKNKNLRKWLGNETTSMTFYKGENTSFRDLLNRQVLILDVYYYTSRKLILKDEEGDLLDGSDNPKDLFDHKFRFETYTDKIDWVLCDIDDLLHGNPYISESKPSVETD